MPTVRENTIDQALHELTGEKEPTTEPKRDVSSETTKPRLHSVDASDKVIQPRQDEPVKKLTEPSGNAYHTSMLLAFQETKLLNPIRPVKSSFLPSSRMMYYVLSEMNKLMVRTKSFIENAGPYHPMLINLGYGVIFCINVLRCQKAANDLSLEDRDLLDKFLDQFPPNILPIPGPLVSLFQAISVSQPPIMKMGIVYPRLPTGEYYNRYTHDPEIATSRTGDTGLPNLNFANWYIPNIPLMMGILRYLSTNENLRQLADRNAVPNVFDYTNNQNVGGVQLRPTFLGHEWPAAAPAHALNLMWTLTTPGLEYRCPATKNINQNFIINGQDIGLPDHESDSTFDTLADYLCFNEGFQWFGNILPILTDFCAYFKHSTTLAQCPIDGSAANQIIIRYHPPERPLTQPRMQGDPRSVLPLAFNATTISTITSRMDELNSFFAQINVSYPPEFPAHAHLEGPAPSVRIGPFWRSSTIEFRTLEDANYTLIPTVIKKEFHIVKPEN